MIDNHNKYSQLSFKSIIAQYLDNTRYLTQILHSKKNNSLTSKFPNKKQKKNIKYYYLYSLIYN